MRRVLVVVPDLFFAARIAETARTLGVDVIACAPEALADRARAVAPAMAIVDLQAAGAIEGIRSLRASPAASGMRVVGFHSHVDQATKFAALEAGATEVLPRSVFTFKLAGILAGQ